MATWLDKDTYNSFKGANVLADLADQYHAQIDQATSDPPTSSDSLTNPLGTAGAVSIPAPAIPSPSPAVSEPATPTPAADTANPTGLVSDSTLPGPAPLTPSSPVTAPLSRAPLNDISQFGQSGVSYDEALAACGPAAAVRLASTYGNNIPLRDVVAAARQSGLWDAASGMHGIDAEKKLLDQMHISAKVDYAPDVSKIIADAQSGNTVTLSTPNHYFTITGYDPNSGLFDVGQSGTAYRTGAARMSWAQIKSIGGGINGALFVDNPTTPTPSIAISANGTSSEQGASGSVGTAAGGNKNSLDTLAADLHAKIDDAANAAGQVKDNAAQSLNDLASGFHAKLDEALNGASQGASTLAQGQESVGRGATRAADAVGNFLTEPQPFAENVVGAQTKQMQAGAGISPNEPGTQDLTPAEQYAQARGIASGLAQTVAPESLGIEAVKGTVQAGAGPVGDALAAFAKSKLSAQADVNAAAGGLPGLIEKLGRYSPDEQAGFHDFVQKMTAAGQKPEEIGDTIRQWMEENPPPAVAKAGVVPKTAPEPTPSAPVTAPEGMPKAEVAPAETFDVNGNQVTGSSTVPSANAAQAVSPQGQFVPGNQNIPGKQGGAVPPNGTPPGGKPPSKIISAAADANPPPPTEPIPPPVQKAGITPETVQIAHERIDKAIQSDAVANQAAHDQLDQMLADGDSPAEVARFLTTDVEAKTVSPMSVLRTVRTGSMAGGIPTEGKVLAGPAIQIAMRAPTAAIKALITGNAADIPKGLVGGLGGLAEGAQEALQTIKSGINYRSALTGGAGGGYGFTPGIDVLGTNAAQRVAGTLATGLVRTHGAMADVSAGIGRGANAATGATPQAAQEAGQQWALRGGNYGTVGKMVADAIEGIKKTNPAMDVAGQILMPFYRVGYNLYTGGVERSPLGIVGTAADVARARLPKGFGPSIRGPYAAGNDASKVTPVGDRLANNLFGVGLAAVGLAQAAQGNITGDRPQGGAPKWSARIAGQWVPLSALNIAGEALAQSASLYESARDGRGDIPKIATTTAQEYVNHAFNTTWLRSIGDVFDTIKAFGDMSGPNPGQAAQATKEFQYQTGSQGKSFIPQATLGGQIASALHIAPGGQASRQAPLPAGRITRNAPAPARPSSRRP